MLVHRFYPLVQKRAFGIVLVRVLPFGFKNQKVSGLEPDNEVGSVLMHHAFEDIEHFEPKMIVLHPRVDVSTAIHLEFVRRFPGAIEDAETDVSSLRHSRNFNGDVKRIMKE